MQRAKSRRQRPAVNRIYLIYTLLIGLGLYVLLPQVGTFRHSFSLLTHLDMRWLALAIIISLAAHLAAALKYKLLALKKLELLSTFLVQLASLLTNRLLPVGIGGAGLNYLYLHKARHTNTQALLVVGMNNLLGFVGHMLLLVILLITAKPTAGLQATWHWPQHTVWAVAAGGLLVLVVALMIAKQKGLLASLRKDIRAYRNRWDRLAGAVLCSLLIAASYALCLWYSALALGVSLSWVAALVVLTASVAATTVTPTPGGLIGVEAALVAGLVAYRVSAADALAIALLYRLITYWFSLVVGAAAFVAIQRRQLI